MTYTMQAMHAAYAHHAHCDIRSVTKLRLKGSQGSTMFSAIIHRMSLASAPSPIGYEFARIVQMTLQMATWRVMVMRIAWEYSFAIVSAVHPISASSAAYLAA